ncbi:hypothetical protein GCM10023184_36860 [Flaviaesturariibacter amylovorans]|uniref:Conjugative transposon TraM C-terminal domain-containing protein n=2 Tax=Flaviaesturariibacter amylovorans TaxID=1084520 RepID=A0ABP8HHZ0_9BACT
MAFWALGGGKGTTQATEAASTGLNMHLPPAQLKEDGSENKMSFYEAAERKAAGLDRTDSVALQPLGTRTDTSLPAPSDYPFATPPGVSAHAPYRDPNEERIYRKLDELNRQLTPAASGANMQHVNPSRAANATAGGGNRSVDELEGMIPTPTSGGSEPDPELESLNGMMDKILDIQHPERVRERLKAIEEKKRKEALTVTAHRGEAHTSLLGSGISEGSENGFYGIEEVEQETKEEGTIEAVVHGTQTLINGSVAKLRLLQDLTVGSRTVPKGAFVYGVINLNGERAEMNIPSIHYGGSLLPVQLEVYDIDGLPGLYIPGAITRETVKSSADASVQTVDIGMMDPSLKAQAASAGLSTVKSFLGKKTKMVRITVKAGYRVFLKNKTNSSN